ncbi:hypothetical protein I3V23_12345 [Rhodobacterales bacterium HKCCA1288]|jgi:hypothetical protein|nr:hypothetical protein I3V23_12345 [Rhodobacterales bacterium HKCCA1288]
MYDLKVFSSDFETAKLQNKERGNVTVDTGWEVYLKTKNTPLDFVIFGRHLRDDNGDLREQKKGERGITPKEMDNFKHPSSKGSANSLEGGSILSLVKGKWSVTYNDAWLCGAVHGLKEFHCASDLSPENVFDEKFGLTVTGRELVGLHIAGFIRQQTIQKDGSLYVVFKNGVTANPTKLTLAAYSSMVAQLDTKDKAEHFMRKEMNLWS